MGRTLSQCALWHDRSAAGLPLTMSGKLSGVDIDAVFRQEHGRAVAVLVRVFGDIDLAEDAVQDAFAIALQRWPAFVEP